MPLAGWPLCPILLDKNLRIKSQKYFSHENATEKIVKTKVFANFGEKLAYFHVKYIALVHSFRAEMIIFKIKS